MTTKDLIIAQLSQRMSDGTPGFDVRAVDFHALGSSQVERLLHWAKAYGYRRPKNASGSTARYFFYLLQRHANKGLT